MMAQRAADILWAMSAFDWYRMLVEERRWSAEEFEAPYVTSLSSFLLDTVAPGG